MDHTTDDHNGHKGPNVDTSWYPPSDSFGRRAGAPSPVPLIAGGQDLSPPAAWHIPPQ
ncbi:UNVERIFIED_CONTAM: hypothetical protein Sangu_2604500 [Sesamum angustifolium]|uniref:Uncharacterized protein n=1 Tax=Sesamum angustifolium TaxID=2727405 RepID=A0AAW2J4W0_9LAMI